MTELETAKEVLAGRERTVQAELYRDSQAVLAGSERSQVEAWSLADAYDRLLKGMEIPGTDLIAFAEQQADELICENGYEDNAQSVIHVSPTDLRALALSSMCVMAELWFIRQLNDRAKINEALGYLSAQGIPEDVTAPKLLELWTEALEAVR